MAEWIGPGRGSVDPLKESNSNNLDAAAGRASTVEHILERGRDPSDVMSEEAWWLKERKARGLEVPNYNVKASDMAGGEEGSAGGGTSDDRDGDGQPNEEARKKKVAA
jgi:capsid protein